MIELVRQTSGPWWWIAGGAWAVALTFGIWVLRAARRADRSGAVVRAPRRPPDAGSRVRGPGAGWARVRPPDAAGRRAPEGARGGREVGAPPWERPERWPSWSTWSPGGGAGVGGAGVGEASKDAARLAQATTPTDAGRRATRARRHARTVGRRGLGLAVALSVTLPTEGCTGTEYAARRSSEDPSARRKADDLGARMLADQERLRRAPFGERLTPPPGVDELGIESLVMGSGAGETNAGAPDVGGGAALAITMRPGAVTAVQLGARVDSVVAQRIQPDGSSGAGARGDGRPPGRGGLQIQVRDGTAEIRPPGAQSHGDRYRVLLWLRDRLPPVVRIDAVVDSTQPYDDVVDLRGASSSAGGSASSHASNTVSSRASDRGGTSAGGLPVAGRRVP